MSLRNIYLKSYTSSDGQDSSNNFSRVTQLFWLLITATCLAFISLANAQADAGSSERKVDDPWLYTFRKPIGEFYLLKPIEDYSTGLTTGDIYVEIIDLQKNQSELVNIKTKQTLGIGCFLSPNSEDESSLHSKCKKKFHALVLKNQVQLPDCNLRQIAGSSKNYEPIYFVSQSKLRISCVYGQTHVVTSNRIPDPTTKSKLTLREIYPLWEKAQYVSGPLTHFFFPNAPFWQANEYEKNARYCNQYPSTIGAFTGSSAFVTALANPLLVNSNLNWAYVYLVKNTASYTCSDTRYSIDLLTKIVEFPLSDGTALIFGNRNILRINLNDGATKAQKNKFKRVEPRNFIKIVRADGADGCATEGNQAPCKWLNQQGWYKYSQLREDTAHEYYGKFWFQGFDQAISRIFFSTEH